MLPSFFSAPPFPPSSDFVLSPPSPSPAVGVAAPAPNTQPPLIFEQQSQLAELSSIEAAWNMNKFAHEARKQRLVDVCVVALSEAGKLLKEANVNKRSPDNLNAEFRFPLRVSFLFCCLSFFFLLWCAP